MKLKVCGAPDGNDEYSSRGEERVIREGWVGRLLGRSKWHVHPIPRPSSQSLQRQLLLCHRFRCSHNGWHWILWVQYIRGKSYNIILHLGRCGSGGRAVVWQSEGCRFDPTLGVSKCPWARHLTPNCSWRAGWYLAWQPIAVGVWMCVWMGEWEAKIVKRFG